MTCILNGIAVGDQSSSSGLVSNANVHVYRDFLSLSCSAPHVSLSLALACSVCFFVLSLSVCLPVSTPSCAIVLLWPSLGFVVLLM